MLCAQSRLALALALAASLLAVRCSSGGTDGGSNDAANPPRQDAGNGGDGGMRIADANGGLDGAGSTDGSGVQDGSTAGDGGTTSDAAPPDAAPPELRSGSRIRARVLRTDDGAKQFVGWFDSTRHENCQFMTAGDGVLRCLPIDGSASAFFSDMQCTQHVAYVTPGSACTAGTSTYAAAATGPTCTRTWHLFPIGALITPAPAHYFYRAPDGSCAQGDVGTGELHQVGPEIAAASFSGAQIVNGPVAGGVEGTYLAGDDGLSQHVGFQDTNRNLPCMVGRTDDGEERCLPPQGGYHPLGVWYADVHCTVEAAVNFTSNCSDNSPFVFEFTGASDCGSLATVYERGAVVTSSSSFTKSGTICQPVPPDVFGNDGRLYLIGPRIASASFPHFHKARDPAAATRLVHYLDVSDMGLSLLRTTEWYDSQRTEDCEFATQTAGTMRCLPESRAQTFFTDSGCMTRVAGYTTTQSCHPIDQYLRDVTAAGMCSFDIHMYSLGATVTPSQVFLEVANQCQPVATSANLFRSVSSEVPASDFVSAMPAVE